MDPSKLINGKKEGSKGGRIVDRKREGQLLWWVSSW
jgi:hypothetical protein